MNKYVIILWVQFVFSFGVESISLPHNAIEIASSNSGLANSQNIGFNFSNIGNTSKGFKISSINWYQNIKGGNIEYHWSGKNHHYISLFNLSADDIDLRYLTPSENPIDIFSIHHVLFSYGFGTKLKENIRIGIKTNLIYNQLYTDESTGYNFDFGLSYDYNNDLSLGIALNNLGIEKTKNESLNYPLEAGIGISYHLKDIKSTFHSDFVYHESLSNDLALRLSSTTQISNFNFIAGLYHTSDKTEFSCGLTFRYRKFELDYGISFHQALGSPYIFSLKYDI
ncbi:MAG: hypothetical protein CMG07_03165 [Candidatus Marinimicrobia bacterium]|nr:hypothetical protein [Candidatus Neomarinimicrobiota bacterium]|tara:strand:+ start:12766 stop:13611 length:846 start_codon:yes stop_codon:yes gene_type:complete